MKLAISALGMHSRQSYLKAGISRYAYCLIDELCKRGLDELHVFVLEDFEVPKDWANKIALHPVSMRRWRKKVLWEMFGSVAAMRRLNLDWWLSTAHAVPRIGFCKRALMVHDLFPLRFPHLFKGAYSSQVSYALKWSIRNSDLLLSNSVATKDDLISTLGVSSNKVFVTPLGPGNLYPRVERGNVTRDVLRRMGVEFERYLVTLSSIGPRKNIPNLIRAFAEITREPDMAGLGLVVAGAAEWKASEVNAEVIKLGLTGRVVFPGYIPDDRVPALFAGAEAFVFPSLHEGFGIPLLEAMYYGVPCCATGRGALREVGGTAAQYFDPEDPKDIAQTVLSLLRNPDKHVELIALGFEQASQFTWSNNASATLAALNSVR